MLLPLIAIISGVMIVMLAIILVVFARAVLSDTPDDTSSAYSNDRTRSTLSRFWTWLSKPRPRLDYRRDKRGRFRKVRRG